jgi:hypothetical protein
MKTGINESQLDYQKPNIRVGIEYKTGRLRDGKVEYGYVMDWGTIASGLVEAKPHNLATNYGADINSLKINYNDSWIIHSTNALLSIVFISGTNGTEANITSDKLNIERSVFGNQWIPSNHAQLLYAYVALTYTKTADPVLE